MKLTSARIFVRDIAEASAFYGQALGLVRSTGGVDGGVLIFNTGGMQLVVETVPRDAPPDEHTLIGRFTGLCFAVDDIHASHARLLRLGVQFVGEPEQQDWGGWLATFRDPAGNEMQLVQSTPKIARQ